MQNAECNVGCVQGEGFGKSSAAVVVDAKHMSSRWQQRGESTPVLRAESVTIGDLVKAAGAQYGLLTANCWHAVERMVALLRTDESVAAHAQ